MAVRSENSKRVAINTHRVSIDVELRQAEREPSRAERIETLRHAAQATANAAIAPWLGLLFWPVIYPRHRILVDLGVHASRFTIVTDGNRQTWRHLYGARPDHAAFDPFRFSKDRDELAVLIRQRRFEKLFVGHEACRAEFARVGEGVRP